MTELHKDVKEIDVDSLTPYPNNPKEHPEQQVDKIASSIKNYGFTQPVVVDENRQIIIGHGRVQAAKKLDMDKVPVIERKDLSKAEVKALRLADNKVAESGFDDESLAVELQQLNESEIDLSSTGFDEDEFTDLLDDFEGNGLDGIEDPESESPDKVETDIEKGEIYRLGDHFLMCGDATDKEDVSKLMQGEKADLVFTDPPYGIEFQSNSRSNQFDELENDDKILDFRPILSQFVNQQGHRYICTGEQVYHIWRKKFSENYKNTLIWDKGNGGMGDLQSDYAPQYEMIIFCNPENTNLNGKRESNIWKIGRDNVNEYDHPTQKPVELPAKAIKNSSNREDIVLDLFAGSGSTLLAAEQTQRKCYAMELEPKYCQVIINRWEELTGKEAEKQ